MREFINKNINKIVFILSFIAIFLSLAISFDVAQRESFFYPNKDIECHQKLGNFNDFDEVNINVSGKRLNGWIKYNNDRTQKKPLLICFLGNSQNSASFCYNFYEKFTYFEGYNFLVIDYPKFGNSEGQLNEKEMFNNVEKIYDYAVNLECVDKENIVIMGYSIGTGFATYLASKKDVNGLILLAPYDNALNLYNDNLNIFYGILEKTRKYKLESDVYAQNVNVNPLVIASENDEVIKYQHSVDLFNKFKKSGKFVTLKIGHDDFLNSIETLENIEEYLQERL